GHGRRGDPRCHCSGARRPRRPTSGDRVRYRAGDLRTGRRGVRRRLDDARLDPRVHHPPLLTEFSPTGRRPYRTRTIGVVTVAPEGRKLLRIETRNAQTPIERKPNWIKTRAKMGPEYTDLKGLVRREGLHTVCEEAGCPNIYECWED